MGRFRTLACSWTSMANLQRSCVSATRCLVQFSSENLVQFRNLKLVPSIYSALASAPRAVQFSSVSKFEASPLHLQRSWEKFWKASASVHLLHYIHHIQGDYKWDISECCVCSLCMRVCVCCVCGVCAVYVSLVLLVN